MQLPETGFIRLRQLLTFIPVSKSKIWMDVKAGTFPAPIKLSARTTVWKTEVIRAYIDGTWQPSDKGV